MDEKQTFDTLTMDDLPVNNPPRDQVQQGPSTEAWTGIYLDYRTECMYKFLEDAFTGGGGFSGKIKGSSGQLSRDSISYITPNPTERFYITRVRTSVYTNHLSKAIRAKVEPVFSQKPIDTMVVDDSGKEIKGHPYQDFLDDIDGAGTCKNDRLKVVSALAYLNAVVFEVMDRLPGGIKPFVYTMQAKDVESYDTSKAGGLSMIAFHDGEDEIKGEENAPKRIVITADSYSKQKYSNSRKMWVEYENIPNTIGEIPVRAVFGQLRTDSKCYLPVPDMYQIAQICHWIFDKESNLDWLIQKQAHDTIVINGDVEGIGRGTDNALIIPGSDQKLFQPFALSPDASKATVHQDRIDRKLQDLAEILSQSGVIAKQGTATAQSGVSKAYTFIATNDALKGTVQICKGVESWYERMYKLFMGEASSIWKTVTDYPQDFQPRPVSTVSDALDAAKEFQSFGLLVNCRAALKDVVYLSNPTASSEELEAQIDEIDKTDLLAGAQ